MSDLDVFLAPPSAPGVPDVTDVSKDSCVLTWTEPKSDGGAIVTDYVIERRSGVHWIPLKQKTTLTTYQVGVGASDVSCTCASRCTTTHTCTCRYKLVDFKTFVITLKVACCALLQVTELHENTKYEFRVSALNKIGVGAPSDPSQPVVTKDPWSEPTFPHSPVFTIITYKNCLLCAHSVPEIVYKFSVYFCFDL